MFNTPASPLFPPSISPFPHSSASPLPYSPPPLPPSSPNLSYQCYDIEVLSNFFSVTFVPLTDRSIKYQFVISPWRNDYLEMVEHLSRVEGLVGYNNVGFDYPVLHPLLVNVDKFREYTGAKLAKFTFKRAEKVLSEDFKRDYDCPQIPQRDLYRIWHFNNKGRMVSLKYLQINLDWPDVREMPIHYHEAVKQGAEEQMILDYNLNDVLSTLAFYDKSIDKIKHRKALSAKYNIDMGNFNNGQIGSRLFMLKMAEMTGKSEKELASRKTYRKSISIADCLVNNGNIEFKSKEFRGVLEQFKSKVITNTRKKDKKDGITVYFDGMRYDFGFGGLHGSRESGIYKNIVSADVSSYYPNTSISYRIYPQHLTEAFCDAYQEIYNERKLYNKGTPENLALKDALNIPFGQSNAEWSPFYDPAYLIKITVNGQLLLAQLCEMITLAGAGRIIMVNTDGIEVDVHNRKQFDKVCSQWQTLHKYTLEFSTYKILALRDSNAYIGQKDDGKIKEKGDYLLPENREIWKDQSMKIVQTAVKEYFINGVPVEKTIGDCKDIKMFLMGKRAKTGNLEWRKAETLTELIKEKLPKNVRYYVSRSGGSIVKVLSGGTAKTKKKDLVPENQTSLFDLSQQNSDVAVLTKKRIVNLHSGWRMTLFNKWISRPFEEYGVEKAFYVNESKKLIDAVMKSQTKID